MSPGAQPPPNFDRIARAYRWLEYLTLGPVLEHLRLHHLKSLEHLLDPTAQALILGDGDGRFTARLLAACPGLHADVVDSSAGMLGQLQIRTRPAKDRIRLHRQDAVDFHADNDAYDLVVTHFFLDCFDPLHVEQLVTKIVPTLKPAALWLVSEFRIPPGLLRWPATLYVRALYLAFRMLTGLRTTRLPDYAKAFEERGLKRIAVHHALCGLLTTELWQCEMNLRAHLPVLPDARPGAPGLAPPNSFAIDKNPSQRP